MLRSFLYSLLLLAISPAQVQAAGVDFWVWKPDPRSAVEYLLPKLPGEKPENIARGYLSALKSSPVYGWMRGVQTLGLSTSPSNFKELTDARPGHPNIAVVVNRPQQMAHSEAYLAKVIDSFEHEGPRLLEIPVGIETILTPVQMQEFRRKLDHFDGMLGIGGDDPHPLTYGQSDTSRTRGDISTERDLEQMATMREYLEHGKGRVFFICASMQRMAIDDGRGFHADISHLTQAPHESAKGSVILEVEVDPNSELALAAGATRFKTSNFHHAAVDPGSIQNPARIPKTQIVAYNIEPDGSRGKIVKAIEFADNAGFATQFHPEFRGSAEEARMIRYVAAGWKIGGRPPRETIAACVLRELGAP